MRSDATCVESKPVPQVSQSPAQLRGPSGVPGAEGLNTTQAGDLRAPALGLGLSSVGCSGEDESLSPPLPPLPSLGSALVQCVLMLWN